MNIFTLKYRMFFTSEQKTYLFTHFFEEKCLYIACTEIIVRTKIIFVRALNACVTHVAFFMWYVRNIKFVGYYKNFYSLGFLCFAREYPYIVS
jgi:hypothetical protein